MITQDAGGIRMGAGSPASAPCAGPSKKKRSKKKRGHLFLIVWGAVALSCASCVSFALGFLSGATTGAEIWASLDGRFTESDAISPPALPVSTSRSSGKIEDAGDSKSPKVLYTVFAGRKNRLLLQEAYWAEMARIGAVDEVHIWDFVPRSSLDDMNEDRKYLEHVGEKYSSFLTIMDPSRVPMEETYWFDHNHSLPGALAHYGNGKARFHWAGERWYAEYYKYYATHPYDGVIIKADDDIVWVNSTMVRPFAKYLWDHRDIFLLSASVVNQGLCAYYQQQSGAVPASYENFPFPSNGMGHFHTNGTQALRMHKYFLASEENRRKFFITEPEYHNFTFTINTNFVAIRGEDFYKTFELIQEKLREEGRYYDEGAITWDPIRKRKYVEGIYMPLVVAHATYGLQVKATKDILLAYVDYARRERADLYGDILNDWSADGRNTP